MKAHLTAVILTLAIGSLTALALADSSTDELAELKLNAREAAKGLGKSLKTELKAALKDAGPVHAIGVCQTVAPTLAAAQSEDSGFNVGRTALRIRNPDNAPDAFEIEAMKSFVIEAESGKSFATMERAAITTNADGSKTFRYLKPIPMMEKPCLACHGSDLAPDVEKAITQRYPNDQATGFKPGDLRGAFTISKPL
ncbi:MAG: DUF3365 domain-containing protein [Pseudomonadota bacterium]